MDIEEFVTRALSKRWAIVGRWKQKQKLGGKLHRTRRVWERHWEEKSKDLGNNLQQGRSNRHFLYGVHTINKQ